MKYALYHFEIDNSLYVGESSWILDLDEVDRDNNKFDFESGPVEVSWPYGREKNSVYSAAVLKFSDNKQDLNEFMQKELAENTELQMKTRSTRAKKSRSDDSCDEEVPSKKVRGSTGQNQKKLLEKSGGAVLNAVKEQLLKASSFTDSDPTAAIMTALKELPCIVNKVNEVVATLQQTANKLANMTPSNFGLSASSNPTTSNFIIAPSTPSSSASNYTLGTLGPSTPSTASCSTLNSSGPSVQRSTPPSVQRSTPPSECDTFGNARKMTNNLLHSIFTMQELLTCTVAVGANPLPQDKVKEIIETIQNSYPSCSNALIKQWMRDKISNTKKRVAMKNAGAIQNLISSDLRA